MKPDSGKFGRSKGSDFFDQRRDRGAVKFLAIRTPPVGTGTGQEVRFGAIVDFYPVGLLKSNVKQFLIAEILDGLVEALAMVKKRRIPGKHGVIRVARGRLVADEEFLRLVVLQGDRDFERGAARPYGARSETLSSTSRSAFKESVESTLATEPWSAASALCGANLSSSICKPIRAGIDLNHFW